MIVEIVKENLKLQVKGELVRGSLVPDGDSFTEKPPYFDIDEVWYNNTNITKLLEGLELMLDPQPDNILFNAIEHSVLKQINFIYL